LLIEERESARIHHRKHAYAKGKSQKKLQDTQWRLQKTNRREFEHQGEEKRPPGLAKKKTLGRKGGVPEKRLLWRQQKTLRTEKKTPQKKKKTKKKKKVTQENLGNHHTEPQ